MKSSAVAVPPLPVSVAACGPSVALGGAASVAESARGGSSARAGGLPSVRGLFRRKQSKGSAAGAAADRGSREASEDEGDAADPQRVVEPGETYIL